MYINIRRLSSFLDYIRLFTVVNSNIPLKQLLPLKSIHPESKDNSAFIW
ncbi:hypothetical protein BMETH_558_1 [methanotrophic bacterial endosymbiont of Bathymodiolus sp.]|nr:hypothetical protein BMETH_558_1 [methanotrophic bacterial endosymbiont of Bathymodiolus sp.]